MGVPAASKRVSDPGFKSACRSATSGGRGARVSGARTKRPIASEEDVDADAKDAG